MSIDPLEFIAEFRAEATEHLALLDEQLLRLERDPHDLQAVRGMFLAAHSIKGGAAMLGLVELRELAHALEDVLGALRDDRRELDAPITEALFRGVDQLRALLPLIDGVPRPSTPVTLEIMTALVACLAVSAAPLELHPDEARRVLLVEDSPSVRQVETFLLEDAGFIVDVAAAGNDAVERIRAVRYVLLIAGVETRELRGPELVRVLREGTSQPDLPVLLTTTDLGPDTPSPTISLAFVPKGRLLGDTEFVRHVHDMTARRAA